MIILGISDSIESHACVFRDGKLLSFISEERLSRVKADAGYPKLSIEKVLEIAKIKKKDIDYVALSGFDNGTFQCLYKPGARFSVKEWIKQNELYWKPKLLHGKKLSELDDFNFWKKSIKNLKSDPYYPFIKKANNQNIDSHLKIFNEVRRDVISKQVGISKNKIFTFRHEECHKAYSLFSEQKVSNKNKVLVTIEGGGDDSSATISIFKNNKINEIYKTNDAMLGRIYRYITLLLGMKPGQHEYKVMGLAPYGTEYHGKNSLNFFWKFNSIDGFKIKRNKNLKDIFFTARKSLNAERFDGIAWGLQKFTEQFLTKWINNIIKKTKIDNVLISGGVAQNIKALKTLSEQKLIKNIWAGPISGDGSLAIGACCILNKKKKNKFFSENLKSPYLGSEIHQIELEKTIKQKCKKFKIIKNPTNKLIANFLNKGLIIARCKGRMEFGQRALGNRSILADPRNYNNVKKINDKIKYRDFWMPFTPTIMYEHLNKIIINPKKIYSPFMTMAFDVKENFKDKIPAVIHPGDGSTRPQMLKKNTNEDFYNLIKEFYKITKIPLLLNTSFNLHGDAIVENAKQAIQTFLYSDLDILLINNFAICRRTKV